MSENNNTIINPVVLERGQSSCTIKRDAKGVKSYELKVYAESAEEAVEIAKEQSRILDIELDLGE